MNLMPRFSPTRGGVFSCRAYVEKRNYWLDLFTGSTWKEFKKVKAVLGFRAKGRKITRSGEGYRVREARARYNVFMGAEKRI